MSEILRVTNLPDEEQEGFKKYIKRNRGRLIRSSEVLVNHVLNSKEFDSAKYLKERDISGLILDLRESVWEEFLLDEVEFNAFVMKNLHKFLDTPLKILDALIERDLTDVVPSELEETVKNVCGEYAGRVFPYIYFLSLSNTNSRRSRSGKTLEAIIYSIYNELELPFDSQGKIGRKIFSDVGLGKKVDSVLPGIDQFRLRRNKTIIGTMKTSLRERWQEVAEEIERTKIPEIHLLTVDDYISKSKASEMGKHNIVVVVYKHVKEEHHADAKNIISFEEYFFDEIPGILKYWKDEV